MRIKQQSELLDEGWWKWSVELEGEEEELDNVKFVEYTLHETFPDPIRRIHDRSTNFRLETAGWGEFTIYAKVVFKDKSHERLQHDLVLLHKDGSRPTE